ncbi:MAG: hypothetical protein NC517_11855 [Firmicutes bacterium]|nr:hypothetical protein [Bacillota bacterium]
MQDQIEMTTRSRGSVESFTEKALPFYQSEERDVKKDEETLALYNGAVEESLSWLCGVLRRDILENGYEEVSAVLELPSGAREITVKAEEVRAEAPLFFQDESVSVRTPEIFHMPIGDLDLYTFNQIVWEQGNPVRLLFEHLSAVLTSMRGSLSHVLAERNQYLVTDEMLKEYKWYDVLGLHRMMYVAEVLPVLSSSPQLKG